MNNWPTEFKVKDVRCFAGQHKGLIRPITLLVGENSTGKSTFLGCLALMNKLFSPLSPYLMDPNFNEEPFLLGSFRDLVRARRGKDGQIEEFELGMKFENDREVSAWFQEEGSQPKISRIRYGLGERFVQINALEEGLTRVVTPEVEQELQRSMIFLALGINDGLNYSESTKSNSEIHRYLEKFIKKWGEASTNGSSNTLDTSLAIAMAPLRAQPKRTYDPIGEAKSPEGSHIPMLMMRLARNSKNEWNILHDQLVDIGKESGLFRDIKVKTHGNQISDPFQIQVKVNSGTMTNIMDVGYGVNQSLPIMAEILELPGKGFILQQPEVHLHPRGQAALGTFFVESVTQRKNRFLIETHSDFIVDRVRISVRKQLIKPSDVSILYFEPQNNHVNVHSITLDQYGNLMDVPPGYRDFFARETDTLLGFDN